MAWLKKLIAYAVTLGVLVNPLLLVQLVALLVIASQIPGQARFRRKMFLQELKKNEATKDKVHVFYLGRRIHHDEETSNFVGESTEGDSPLSSGGPAHRDEIYCHSKVWIVDDIIAKIGSANCNRRSYTHDSEMDLVMVDGTLDRGARALARKLRMDLWGEHLGMKWPRTGMLQDHKHALQYWLGSQLPNSHIREYKEDEEVSDLAGFNLGWGSILDPDGGWDRTQDLDAKE